MRRAASWTKPVGGKMPAVAYKLTCRVRSNRPIRAAAMLSRHSGRCCRRRIRGRRAWAAAVSSLRLGRRWTTTSPRRATGSRRGSENPSRMDSRDRLISLIVMKAATALPPGTLSLPQARVRGVSKRNNSIADGGPPSRSEEEVADPVGYRRHRRAGRNSQDPGPNDAGGQTPADTLDPLGGPHADNGAGDGVGGGYRNAQGGGQEQGHGPTGFCAETAHRLQLGELLPHGLDDAPAAEQIGRASCRERV